MLSKYVIIENLEGFNQYLDVVEKTVKRHEGKLIELSLFKRQDQIGVCGARAVFTDKDGRRMYVSGTWFFDDAYLGAFQKRLDEFMEQRK